MSHLPTSRVALPRLSLAHTLHHGHAARRASAPNISQPIIVRTKFILPYKRPLMTHAVAGHAASTASTTAAASGLSRLNTSTLLRNILFGFVFTSPLLLRMTLLMMKKVAKSESAIFSVDRNPLLRAMLKPVVYNHFCAGAVEKEIAQTRGAIKQMGFSGVVLCFGKEVQLSAERGLISTGSKSSDAEAAIKYWREGTLETLEMTREGDWIGIKLTGAGSEISNMLMEGQQLPQSFRDSLDLICERARQKGCKIWIDAEQQAVQAGIDECTIGLMRRFNKDGSVLVYNTLQSYLKSSKDKLQQQLAMADREGWELAVKLVRGAYISNDQRGLIHDTKEDTDDSYESIIRDVLRGTNLGFTADQVPRMQLLIAGHNPDSVIGAFELMQQLHSQGALKVRPDFAQLQGMADVLGCELIRRIESFRDSLPASESASAPKIYKCLTWGSVQECIQYLYRRLVENSSASERIKDGLSAHLAELRRRSLGR